MAPPPRSKPLIRCLISDTGGGHRAAADAVRAAASTDVDVEVIDILVAAGGLSAAMPAWYDWFNARPYLWGPLWHLFDRPKLAWLLSDPFYALQARTFGKLINEGSPDVVAVFHPCCTRGTRAALAHARDRSGLVTVVTDPVTPHSVWFERDVDHVFVSSEAARTKAASCGVDGGRLSVLDHPVHPRVHRLSEQRDALRERYGWAGQKVILITGGGGGVGIEAAMRAVESLGAKVVVCCGRNERLRTRLTRRGVEALGFVDDLPERMCAADLVLTKAGPSTLAECKAVGTPMLITSHIPGQEEGNLAWIESSGAGEVTEHVRQVREAAKRWLFDEARAAELRARAARPAMTAAEQIAESLVRMAKERGRAHGRWRTIAPPRLASAPPPASSEAKSASPRGSRPPPPRSERRAA
jgi:1,2-diacylglycerol 3-beta-galactosyltransferase